MAGNGNNRQGADGPREPNWEGILTTFAAGATAIGALAYMFSGSSETKNESPISTKHRVMSASYSEADMTIAVDATPRRCGGILRLPKSQRVYFYSVDWTSHFSFPTNPENQEPDKFEMVNALVALEAFKPFVQTYIDDYAKLVFKTDNTFFSKTKRFPTSEDKILLEDIKNRLTALEGTWQAAYEDDDDDMYEANKLSRRSPYVPTRFGTDSLINRSLNVEIDTLPTIEATVPHRFRNFGRLY